MYYWTKYITVVNFGFHVGWFFTMLLELSPAKLEEKTLGFCLALCPPLLPTRPHFEGLVFSVNSWFDSTRSRMSLTKSDISLVLIELRAVFTNSFNQNSSGIFNFQYFPQKNQKRLTFESCKWHIVEKTAFHVAGLFYLLADTGLKVQRYFGGLLTVPLNSFCCQLLEAFRQNSSPRL